MKMIVAIIKPPKFEAVREALSKADIKGMTVSEVKGFGRQKGHTEIYRGAEYLVEFIPKLKLEIAVSDKDAGVVKDALVKAANEGETGDGKVFVFNLEEATRIRTGESGDDAI